jgi:sulfur carrier protein
MQILVNGREVEAAERCTIAELLRQLQLSGHRVAVMVNGDVIRRANHDTVELHDQDAIEVITMVGGG